jgi:predicted HicB family RNase H-like nuclease
MSKTQTLNLRVSPEFKRKLMDAAAQQKRSVTNYLEVVLAEIWERERALGIQRNPLKKRT